MTSHGHIIGHIEIHNLQESKLQSRTHIASKLRLSYKYLTLLVKLSYISCIYILPVLIEISPDISKRMAQKRSRFK